MNYYYYISDAKVNMLLPQIGDARTKKISESLGFDFKIFSAKRDVEYHADDRIARLETVVSFIREFGNLGTLGNPDQYIEDSLPMNFVMLSGDNLAYFCGMRQTMAVGMGGSAKHVIGGEPSGNVALMCSAPHPILRALKAQADLPESEAYARGWMLAEVKSIAERFKTEYPLENLRFMAKRLAANEDNSIVLATPLYVSKED